MEPTTFDEELLVWPEAAEEDLELLRLADQPAEVRAIVDTGHRRQRAYYRTPAG
jgi:hypothetical protein